VNVADVADVLRDRSAEPAGLDRMVVVSVLVHGLVFGGLWLAPEGWLPGRSAAPRTVMTITLGGGNGGPANGGMTSIGGRPVQAQKPPEDVKKPEPVRPPAAKTPVMTLPVPGKAPTKATPSPAVKQAPPDARGRTPTQGAETRPGSAVAETGARGQGFGLSTSGGTGGGARLDVADFCCPEYIVLMVEKIRSNWNARAEVSGETVIKFVIQRDGTIVGGEVEKQSGYTALDINALRAVVSTRQLAALPAAFPNPTLPVHLTFQYTR
jgi:TonB family protein